MPDTATATNEFIEKTVVMMTPGVRDGSQGKVLHLPRFYSQNVEDWNGILVTAGHPRDSQGRFVSIGAVDAEQWVVGYLDNPRVHNNKLKAVANIHEQRSLAVNPEVINYIEEDKNLEVSIGAVTEDTRQTGRYDGNQFNAVTTAYIPDHLALLPGGEGACSWQDGCGVRVNELNANQNFMIMAYKQNDTEEMLLPTGVRLKESKQKRKRKKRQNRNNDKEVLLPNMPENLNPKND